MFLIMKFKVCENNSSVALQFIHVCVFMCLCVCVFFF